MKDNFKNSDKELDKKLNNFLTDEKISCEEEECLIKNNDELVQRENKKIITNDGRQLLNEYF